MNRPVWRSVLRGSNDVVGAAGAVVGVVLAVALAHVLTWNPPVGGPAFELAPVPDGLAGWVAVAAAVAMAATLAALGGGWLACWWLPLPSLFVAYLHYYTAGSGGFVVAGLPTVLVLAAVVSFVLGTAGYLLGVAGRRWYGRSGFVGVREVAGD